VPFGSAEPCSSVSQWLPEAVHYIPQSWRGGRRGGKEREPWTAMYARRISGGVVKHEEKKRDNSIALGSHRRGYDKGRKTLAGSNAGYREITAYP
jgi:hypothetical protein